MSTAADADVDGIPFAALILAPSSNARPASTSSNAVTSWTTRGSFYLNGSASPRVSALPRSVPSAAASSSTRRDASTVELGEIGDDGRPVRAMRMKDGVCACCASRIRWEDGIASYRCPRCDTIGDLRVGNWSGEGMRADGDGSSRIDVDLFANGNTFTDDQVNDISASSHRDLRTLDSAFVDDYTKSTFPPYSTISGFHALVKRRPACLELLRTTTMQLLRRPRLDSSSSGAWVVALFESPLFSSDHTPNRRERMDSIARFLGLVSKLSNDVHHSLVRYLTSSSYPTSVFAQNVALVLGSISSTFLESMDPVGCSDYPGNWQIRAGARVASLFFAANSTKRIPLTSFYCSAISLLTSALITDFESWESPLSSTLLPPPFALCEYPFLLPLGSKILLLKYDGMRQMQAKARESIRSMIVTQQIDLPFLTIEIRRSAIIRDSLRGMSENRDQLKKQLRVKFVGEEGIDGGGLRKEWFLLLIRELFDEVYGMFLFDEESNLCYFNPAMEGDEEEYALVGSIVGLAIYNNVTLDIPLPLAIYKKLQNESVELSDLATLHPVLAKGLQTLLDYEGDVEEDYCRSFVGEFESFGEIVQVPLLEGGDDMRVNKDNRQDYVDRLVHFHLTSSVSSQYTAFAEGFASVASGNALSFFAGEELELVARGSRDALNIEELQNSATYQGFDKDDMTVVLFWRVFNSFSPADQRSLLAFITGSDRIPASGGLHLKIALAGEDGRRFPTSRTCFNQIDLWRYKEEEVMRDRLKRGWEESVGFDLK